MSKETTRLQSPFLIAVPLHALLNVISFSSRLLLLLSEQGTILDRSWRQLREYDGQASQVLPWLNSAEDRLGRYMAQPVKSDPATIRQQIDELKVTHSFGFYS